MLNCETGVNRRIPGEAEWINFQFLGDGSGRGQGSCRLPWEWQLPVGGHWSLSLVTGECCD